MLAVAHRGYSAAHPENSPAAFKQAIAVGADVIETDLRLSQDGVVVCCHDANLERIAGQRVAIGEHPWAQLRERDLPGGQRLMTLPEVLALAAGRVPVLLDVKVQTAEMVRAVLHAAAEATEAVAATRLIYGVRSLHHLHTLRQLAPTLDVLAMPADAEARDAFLEEAVPRLRLWEEAVTAALVDTVHHADCQVWVTTGLRSAGEAVGHCTRDRLAALNAMGVDAVLLNDPALRTASLSPAASAPHPRT